jgi:2-methylcitrate dehydratase PrpD
LPHDARIAAGRLRLQLQAHDGAARGPTHHETRRAGQPGHRRGGRGRGRHRPLRQLLLSRGGTGQARSLVFGDRLPAVAAAQLNGTMCRALDYCDAMAPGIHIGSSLLPAALAAAELRGGCSGAELLAALVVGNEVGARFNLSEAQYDGFDPTGVAIVFASTAAACRVLGLTPQADAATRWAWPSTAAAAASRATSTARWRCA